MLQLIVDVLLGVLPPKIGGVLKSFGEVFHPLLALVFPVLVRDQHLVHLV